MDSSMIFKDIEEGTILGSDNSKQGMTIFLKAIIFVCCSKAAVLLVSLAVLCVSDSR